MFAAELLFIGLRIVLITDTVADLSPSEWAQDAREITTAIAVSFATYRLSYNLKWFYMPWLCTQMLHLKLEVLVVYRCCWRNRCWKKKKTETKLSRYIGSFFTFCLSFLPLLCCCCCFGFVSAFALFLGNILSLHFFFATDFFNSLSKLRNAIIVQLLQSSKKKHFKTNN